MDSLVNYIKSEIRPRDSTEFICCDNFYIEIFERLKQDGMMVCNSPPPSTTKFCEFIKIGNKFLIKKCYKNLQWLEDDNKISFDSTSEPIYRRLLPPPVETVDHPFIIKSVIEESNPRDKTYIEYGICSARNLRVIIPIVHSSYGIDIQRQPGIPQNFFFYNTTTDDFSETMLPKLEYHFAFIDADHKFENSFRDFENLYRYIQPGGYIFLHDTYPCEINYLETNYCNDCYKTPIEIKKKYPGIELLTLPLNPGLTIVRKSRIGV